MKKTKKSRTLPCPFCGASNYQTEFCESSTGLSLVCRWCNAHGPDCTDNLDGNNHAEAVRAWERRSSTDHSRALKEIAQIIEIVDSRAAAVDGPVTNTRHEMTDAEMLRIYQLATGKVRAPKPKENHDKPTTK